MTRSSADHPSSTRRLIVVANRLPVRRVEDEHGSRWVTSPGGLVSALQPSLQAQDGVWIGWSGQAAAEGEGARGFLHDRIEHRVVPLSEEELEGFYTGFSNSTLWPLYHDCVRTPVFHRRWWKPYVDVNSSYAQRAIETAGEEDICWVQDYQLQLVPQMIRAQRPEMRIGFFLHIPFPPRELFAQLPWRTQILEGILGADLVGFQTPTGAQNFLACVRAYTDASVTGNTVRFEDREITVSAFPISIDVQRYEKLALSPEVQARAAELREHFGDRKVFLGVDRLDYTKGIDHRLRAFESLLRRSPEAAERAVLVQIAVPSRESVDEYAELRVDIERLVGRINGTYAEVGTVPVHYLYRSLPIEELVAYYLLADTMVVTPLRDGMNLVAKEYVASRIEDSGNLVLSEFAGAAAEFKRALQVNPHDVDGVAATLEKTLEEGDSAASKRRMISLRRTLRENDVHRWAARFLDTLSS
ncbi:MAG: trehalose-6-phosphate synthase [Planctomycetota bacterium]